MTMEAEMTEIFNIPHKGEGEPDSIIDETPNVFECPNDMEASHRTGKSNAKCPNPSLVATFVSKRVKELINKKSKEIKLSTKALGSVREPLSAFVLEHLFRRRKELFHHVSDLKKCNNWVRPWTHNAKIPVKQLTVGQWGSTSRKTWSFFTGYLHKYVPVLILHI